MLLLIAFELLRVPVADLGGRLPAGGLTSVQLNALGPGHPVMDDVELDSALLAVAEGVHSRGNFAAENAGDAFGDGVLDLVLADDAANALAQALDLETFGDAPNEVDRVDGGTDLLEKGTDEGRLVHRVGEEVRPEVRIILLLGEGDGKGDVA